jgi:hypothetical protein
MRAPSRAGWSNAVLLAGLALLSAAGAGCPRSTSSGAADGGRVRLADGATGTSRVTASPAATGGAVTVMARGPGQPRFLVLDGEHLYFARVPGSVQSTSRSGSGLPGDLVLASEPRGLAVTGGNLYLLDDGFTEARRDGSRERYHRLSRVPRAGGPAEVLARELPLPGGLIADGERLVWPVPAGRVFAPSRGVFLDHPGGLMSFDTATRDTGAPLEPDAAPASPASPAMLVRELRDPVGLAADTERFYVTEPGQARSAYLRDLVAVARDGSERRVLARGEPGPAHLQTDGKYLYWTTWRRTGAGAEASEARTLRAVPVGGGEVITVLGEDADPSGVALGEGFVYTTVPHGVVRVRRGADGRPQGPPQTVAGGLDQKQRAELVVDARAVYWSADGEVRRAPLP